MVSIEQVPPYVVWPVRHEVMYPEKDFGSIKLPEDEDGTHLALFNNNDLVCVVSLFWQSEELQFRKFATVKEFQGMGFGSQLLQHVIEYAQKENIKRLWCNARQNAVTFYQKFGFVETADKFFKDGYTFAVMEMRLMKEEHND